MSLDIGVIGTAVCSWSMPEDEEAEDEEAVEEDDPEAE